MKKYYSYQVWEPFCEESEFFGSVNVAVETVRGLPVSYEIGSTKIKYDDGEWWLTAAAKTNRAEKQLMRQLWGEKFPAKLKSAAKNHFSFVVQASPVETFALHLARCGVKIKQQA